MSIGERARGFLFSPSATFDASRDDTVIDALTFLALNLAIFGTILVFLIATSPGAEMTIRDLPRFVLGIFMVVIGGIVSAYLSGLWIHIWVYLLGGRCGVERTLKATIYSETPIWLLGGAGFIAGAWVASESFDSLGIVIAVIWFILMSIWAYITEIIGIKQLHELSTGRAILATIIPIVIAVSIDVYLNLM